MNDTCPMFLSLVERDVAEILQNNKMMLLYKHIKSLLIFLEKPTKPTNQKLTSDFSVIKLFFNYRFQKYGLVTLCSKLCCDAETCRKINNYDLRLFLLYIQSCHRNSFDNFANIYLLWYRQSTRLNPRRWCGTNCCPSRDAELWSLALG